MNMFDAEGFCKIGNVELKFLVDFEKNADMLLWKTAKHSGFVYVKSILGAHVFQQAVRILTTGVSCDINCDGDETAQKVLDIVVKIGLKLYAGKKLGSYNLEMIGEDMFKTKDGCCGSSCSCEADKSGTEKADAEKDFNDFMSTFLGHLSASFKEKK